MWVPRDLIDEVTRAVGFISDDAEKRVMAVVRSLDWSDITTSRARLVEVVNQVLSNHCELAAALTADMYDALREEEVGEALGAEALTGRDPAATEGAVRAITQHAVDGDIDRFQAEIARRVGYEVRRSANMSVALNAERDTRNVRYARVPQGLETCGYCMALASFGFHYTTEETASHCHDGCDCRVVPDFIDDTEIEGYSPDAMYGEYRHILDDVLGGRRALRARYEAQGGNPSDRDFEKWVVAQVGRAAERIGSTWNME